MELLLGRGGDSWERQAIPLTPSFRRIPESSDSGRETLSSDNPAFSYWAGKRMPYGMTSATNTGFRHTPE